MILLGRRAGRDSVEAQAELRMNVLDAANGHVDLVLLGALGRASDAYASATDHAAALRRRLGLITTLGNLGVQLLAAIALVGTLWAGLVALDAGGIDGPLMAALLFAVLGSFEITSLIVRSTGKATQAMAAAERLSDLADLSPPVIEPTEPLPLPRDGAISVDNLRFAYPGLPAIFEDLSLTIQPGERVAIAGHSGSGKSTLLRLLLRLADPQAGAIRIGGTPLARLASRDVHAHMTLLSQDSPVFIDTIRNNLLIGRPEASDADLWTALEKAQLDTHVRALPKGFDTIVGEAGRTLSVGQARRLCLARALLSNAPVLLLDEPTDALDRETEEAFFKVLAGATAGRTVVLVTHANIPEGTVDRVLTLENGQLR
jgi:ATP-binding cassette subfamily C protein CydC